MTIRLMWNAQMSVMIPKIPATGNALNGYQKQVALTMSKKYAQNHAMRVKMVGWIDCLVMLIRVVANYLLQFKLIIFKPQSTVQIGQANLAIFTLQDVRVMSDEGSQEKPGLFIIQQHAQNCVPMNKKMGVATCAVTIAVNGCQAATLVLLVAFQRLLVRRVRTKLWVNNVNQIVLSYPT